MEDIEIEDRQCKHQLGLFCIGTEELPKVWKR